MLKAILALAVLAVLVVAPFLVGSYYLDLMTTIAIYSILLIGLDIVFGYTGEVSLGHSALFGIGAYAAGCLVYHQLLIGGGSASVPDIFIAIVLGTVVAAAFGVVLALPALRVTGPYLAMVTLAFGTIIGILINEMTFLTNGPLGVTMNRPFFYDWRWLGDTLPFFKMNVKLLKEIQFYFLVVILLVLTIIAVNRIVASRYGRAFEALRDSPIASDCMGVSVYKHKVMAFVVSAALAGLAGSLFAYSGGQYIAPNDFNFEKTIQFLLAVTMGGRKSRLGPILGAIIVVSLPNLLADITLFRYIAGAIAAIAVVAGGVALARKPEDKWAVIVPMVLCVAFFGFALLLQNITDYKRTIYGLMILFVVYYLPEGIVGFLKRTGAQLMPGLVKMHAVIETKGDAAHVWAAASPTVAADGTLLDVNAIVMQFGGLKALDKVSLAVKPGTIHGLIGPNGSGKSTMMNVLTGIYVPTAGGIALEGQPIAGLKSPQIAARGIARTFQNVQLFGELTVIENIMVGLHHTYRSSLGAIALGLPGARKEEQAARVRAASILGFVGLSELANEEARNLPYGKQRLLEIGRALALDPKLLLLDEPAAGLTAPDIKELMEIIRKVRAHGITIILIEHHMDVVMSVCDKVTVLDFGQKIAEGQPAEVQANQRVVEAYLGGASAAAE